MMTFSRRQVAAIVAAASLAGAFWPTTAAAHGVVVWAEDAGDAIRVEAYFSTGAAIVTGTIVAVLPDGTRREVAVDPSGVTMLADPDVRPVAITVDVGAGHSGEFVLD